MSARIDILMATYNGAEFLPWQLASIADQTHADWRLVVRDDGSTDATPRILADFATAHPGRVEIVQDGLGNLRTKGNFSALLERVEGPYAAFSDQDDVWVPERLERTLDTMRGLEAQHGTEGPLMVFSDRAILDETGAPERHWSINEGLDLAIGCDFRKSLGLNVVAGCTALLNRPLARLTGPVPAAAMSHDHWLALVASGLGHVAVATPPVVRWRKHGYNVAGIRAVASTNYTARAKMLFSNLEVHRRRYGALYDQAQAFANRFAGTPKAETAVRDACAFAALSGQTAVSRMLAATRAGLLPPGIERKAGFLMTGSGRV